MASKKQNRPTEVPFLLGVNLSEKQKEFTRVMMDKDARVVFLKGPAGTSKSFLSIYAGLSMLQAKRAKKIVYIRTAVESAERGIGFLCGSADQKFAPYAAVLMDKLHDMLTPEEISNLEKSGAFVAEPINFVRGRDWKDTFVIFDEAQNATKKEILTALTRLNYGTRIIVCGDPQQSDIRNGGFAAFYDVFNNEDALNNGIACLEFGREDIRRDPVVGYISDTFDAKLRH
jgi:phosphate starvation-inducible PhoH-like protein